MTIWQKFQDPVWKQQAEKLQHKNAGGTWQVEKTDDKKTKQHKIKVLDWLFKSNLTEELLLNHPTPDDVKFFRDIRQMAIWDYFNPSDMGKLAAIENQVIHNRKSLNKNNLKTINDCISRAKRLQHKDIRRIGIGSGKEEYEKYKNKLKKLFGDAK